MIVIILIMLFVVVANLFRLECRIEKLEKFAINKENTEATDGSADK